MRAGCFFRKLLGATHFLAASSSQGHLGALVGGPLATLRASSASGQPLLPSNTPSDPDPVVLPRRPGSVPRVKVGSLRSRCDLHRPRRVRSDSRGPGISVRASPGSALLPATPTRCEHVPMRGTETSRGRREPLAHAAVHSVLTEHRLRARPPRAPMDTAAGTARPCPRGVFDSERGAQTRRRVPA